jgi:SAM-dependent methyltransferase
MKDPTARFSDRVADYVKYRPHYPKAIIGILSERLGLQTGWTVADVGSGTGLSSERFLDFGCRVECVEPNRDMRMAAEAAHGGRPNFSSVDGRAEATGLEPHSADLYLSGQAFHWFDKQAARLEALRILKGPKRALLMWNDWNKDDSAFLRDYGAFLDARMPERAESDHRNLGDADFDAFFGRGRWATAEIPNAQRVDFEGLKGRLLSASYAPKQGDPGFGEAMAELKDIYLRHAGPEGLDFGYATRLRFGTIGE